MYACRGVWECCATNVCDRVLLVWPMAVLCNKCVRWMWRMAVFHDSVWLWTLGVTCGSVAWPEPVWLCLHLTWPCCVTSLCDCVYIWHDLWQCCVTRACVTVSTFDMTYDSVVWLCLSLTWPMTVLCDKPVWLCLHLTWRMAVLRDKCVCDCVYIWHDLWQCCVTSLCDCVYIWHDLLQCCVTSVTVSTFDMTHGSVVWQVLPCLHLTWHVVMLRDKCMLLCLHLREE